MWILCRTFAVVFALSIFDDLIEHLKTLKNYLYIGEVNMKKSTTLIVFLMVFSLASYVNGDTESHAPIQYNMQELSADMSISRGGQLYDNWWSTKVDVPKPQTDHPLWITQTSNKRGGYSTWRCKECHGWDYLGKDGAYSKGSHYTGFIGVYQTSRNMDIKRFAGALKGATNKAHDFSRYLSDDDITDIAIFLENGLVDIGEYLKQDGSPVSGSLASGKEVYSRACMTECHGPEGRDINFGDEEKPQFIGTVANKNPWEFLHKVRAGQPGTRMASGIVDQLATEEIRSLLLYSRSLPKDLPEESWVDKMKKKLDSSKEEEKTPPKKQHRGFGPKVTGEGL